jgi:hypothetical protein
VNKALPRILDLRTRSLVRGSALVLLSLFTSALLSDFPRNRPNPWIALPALAATLGTADTIRCIQRRWSFYHAGVLLSIYMDLMALAMIFFFLFYPYLPAF